MPTRLLEALALSAAGDVMAAWLRISSAALMPTSDATETPHAPAPHQPATTPSRNKPQPAAFHRLERRCRDHAWRSAALPHPALTPARIRSVSAISHDRARRQIGRTAGRE